MMNNTRIDNVLNRQRRSLTLDTIFAFVVAFSLLISVIGLTSATSATSAASVTSATNLTSTQVEMSTYDAPGCAPASITNDLIC